MKRHASATAGRGLLACIAAGACTLAPCLPTHPAATAAPAARARIELVPFEHAPFPYDGRPLPGQDKPFFDVEKDGRRGHTAPRGGVYWEDATYSDRRVLLHVPRG